MAATNRTHATLETGVGSDRRRQLVERAAALFDDVGYHNTSVGDLAEACGIRKPTLYHYFKSKDEILFWIHEEFIDILLGRQQAREAEELAPREALLGVMNDVLELMQTHRGYVRVFFEHHRELRGEAKAEIRKKRATYQDSIERLFEQGIASGDFRGVDPRMATLVLAGMCNWAYHWYQPDGKLTSREIAEAFWKILIDGFQDDRQPTTPETGRG
jgi:TetR/AcrR family transcriptional regulator, cholesterol catabolism regulator